MRARDARQKAKDREARGGMRRVRTESMRSYSGLSQIGFPVEKGYVTIKRILATGEVTIEVYEPQ